MQRLKASVQYGDWEGTAAADNADHRSIHDLLREKGMIFEDEFPVGLEFYIGENHNGEVQEPYLSVLLLDRPNYDTVAEEVKATTGPLTFRKVRVDLTLNEFLGLFKRFSVTLSLRGLDIAGREYISY
jgi:hypothetical protein